MDLIVEQGSLAGKVFSLEKSVITIGREAGNDVVIPETGVSRRHARIQDSPEGWMLTDLGSTNGTYVNGQWLWEGHLLSAGDRVRIGSTVLLVQQAPWAGADWREDEGQGGRTSGAPHPLLIVLGAIAALLVLAGIVILLVTILRPEKGPSSPTPPNQFEQIITAMPPLPTEFEDFATSIATMVPSDWLPQLGATPTPTQGAMNPASQQEAASRSLEPLPPVPVPQPPEQVREGQGTP